MLYGLNMNYLPRVSKSVTGLLWTSGVLALSRLSVPVHRDESYATHCSICDVLQVQEAKKPRPESWKLSARPTAAPSRCLTGILSQGLKWNENNTDQRQMLFFLTQQSELVQGFPVSLVFLHLSDKKVNLKNKHVEHICHGTRGPHSLYEAVSELVLIRYKRIYPVMCCVVSQVGTACALELLRVPALEKVKATEIPSSVIRKLQLRCF